MATIFAQQNRNAGTYRTAPANSTRLPDGTISVTAIMDLADLQDAALLVTLGVEANDTPGAGAADPGWYILIATSWQGGAPGRDGEFHAPSFTFSGDNVAARLRGLLMLSKRISIGLDVTVA